jgi:hypothetical protein
MTLALHLCVRTRAMIVSLPRGATPSTLPSLSRHRQQKTHSPTLSQDRACARRAPRRSVRGSQLKPRRVQSRQATPSAALMKPPTMQATLPPSRPLTPAAQPSLAQRRRRRNRRCHRVPCQDPRLSASPRHRRVTSSPICFHRPPLRTHKMNPTSRHAV